MQNKFIQTAIDMTPTCTIKENKQKLDRMDYFDDWVSQPHINRGVMGVTALLTQPALDYYNHKVDEETRVVAMNRTIAKILAGTGVGMFIVRGPIFKLVEKTTNIAGKSKYSKLLLPREFLSEIASNEKYRKNYRNALAASLALLAMCVTNFALDAPLTIFLTNLFNDKQKEAKK